MKKPTKAPVGKTATTAAVTAPRILDKKGQTDLFARGTKCFTSGDFDKARGFFEEAAAGPALEIAESARMYVRMCDQRIGREKVEIRTPEEHYDVAIQLINQRKLSPAQQHLKTALESMPNAAHLHYAMALAKGLGGDAHSAHEHLRRAIELDPQQRALARGDSDFQELMHHLEIRSLIYPDRSSGS
jgi:tetratricopeptide (TPR) repeat protein